jgi:hypothetical protein
MVGARAWPLQDHSLNQDVPENMDSGDHCAYGQHIDERLIILLNV